MAGCPKCAVDLVRANPHKKAKRLPNGFLTFEELRVGEKLRLPEKWFNGELDRRPKAYFAALPYHDGVKTSSLGALADGLLGDYVTFDSAADKVIALAQLSDQAFTTAVLTTGALINQSVAEVARSTNPAVAAYAQATGIAVNSAGGHASDLIAALAAGDQAAAAKARLDAQNELLTALDSARLGLYAVYGDEHTAVAAPQIPTFVPPITTTKPKPAPKPIPTPIVVAETVNAPTPKSGLSTGAVIGFGLAGAAVVGGALYLSTHTDLMKSARRFL